MICTKSMMDTRRAGLEARIAVIREQLVQLERSVAPGLEETRLAIEQLREEELQCQSQLDAIWIARMAAISLPEKALNHDFGDPKTREQSRLPRWRFVDLLRSGKSA